jgi:hypothetical protein
MVYFHLNREPNEDGRSFETVNVPSSVIPKDSDHRAPAFKTMLIIDVVDAYKSFSRTMANYEWHAVVNAVYHIRHPRQAFSVFELLSIVPLSPCYRPKATIVECKSCLP